MKKLINLNGKLIEEMSQEEYMDTFLNCVDYIQVYHNVLSKDECKYFINQHTRLSKKGLSKEGTVNGGFQESRYDKKKKESEDIYLNVLENRIEECGQNIKKYKKVLDKSKTLARKLTYCVSDYLVKVGLLGPEFTGTGIKTFLEVAKMRKINLREKVSKKFHIKEMCLRKYPRYTGGYHSVHMDHQFGTLTRLAAGILYLNTIRKGGETCFPVLGREFKPKAGDYVVFPSYYTHLHYGKIAISNDRYIVATHTRWSGTQEQEIKENKDG